MALCRMLVDKIKTITILNQKTPSKTLRSRKGEDNWNIVHSQCYITRCMLYVLIELFSSCFSKNFSNKEELVLPWECVPFKRFNGWADLDGNNRPNIKSNFQLFQIQVEMQKSINGRGG